MTETKVPTRPKVLWLDVVTRARGQETGTEATCQSQMQAAMQAVLRQGSPPLQKQGASQRLPRGHREGQTSTSERERFQLTHASEGPSFPEWLATDSQQAGLEARWVPNVRLAPLAALC